MSNEEVLLTVLISFPSRPDEIVFTFEFEHSRIDSPFVAGIADLALQSPGALDRIVIVVFDDIDAMRSIVGGIGGEVDIPFVAPAVEFGRPQLVRPFVSRFRGPNRLLFRMPQVRDIRCFAKSQVLAGCIRVIVEPLPPDHPRVRSGLQQWVRKGTARGCGGGLLNASANNPKKGQRQKDNSHKTPCRAHWVRRRNFGFWVKSFSLSE